MNQTTLNVLKEKLQPTRELLGRIHAALEKHPAIYEAERLEELKLARSYARKQLQTRKDGEAARKAQDAIGRLDVTIRQIEENGPYTPTDAKVYAMELTQAIQDAERWVYVCMLYDLLDVFTTLTYWQDALLDTIDTGYAFFNNAQYWPEHWKLATHSETELHIMALVDEITEIVMEEGKDISNELHE